MAIRHDKVPPRPEFCRQSLHIVDRQSIFEVVVELECIRQPSDARIYPPNVVLVSTLALSTHHSVLSKIPGGSTERRLYVSSMFDVSAGASFKDVGFGVRGRSFIIAFTSHINVDRILSVTRRDHSLISSA